MAMTQFLCLFVKKYLFKYLQTYLFHTDKDKA